MSEFYVEVNRYRDQYFKPKLESFKTLKEQTKKAWVEFHRYGKQDQELLKQRKDKLKYRQAEYDSLEFILDYSQMLEQENNEFRERMQDAKKLIGILKSLDDSGIFQLVEGLKVMPTQKKLFKKLQEAYEESRRNFQ